MIGNIKKLECLKSILNEEMYNDFINVVGDKQHWITRIYTDPIDNYNSGLITDNENLELLRYVYQNVRYYLRQTATYKPKLEEGMALFASKSAVLKQIGKDTLDRYFALGEHSYKCDLANPFEEVARLLLNATKHEYFELNAGYDNILPLVSRKKEIDKEYIDEILRVSLSKGGIKEVAKCYGCEDFVSSIEDILEESSINSNDVKSATTKNNKEVILNVIDKVTDLYCTRVDLISSASVVATPYVVEVAKNRFENKIIHAKRNIGMYEKTKKIVKESQ